MAAAAGASTQAGPSSAVQTAPVRRPKGTAERVRPDFLSVILDLNPLAWQNAPAGPADPAAAYAAVKGTVATLLVFLNAHTSMHSGNGLAVYGAASKKAELLFSTSAHSASAARRHQTDSSVCVSLPFRQVDDATSDGVQRMLSEACSYTVEELRGHVGMTRALALALCHIHRMSALSRISDHDTRESEAERMTQNSADAYRFRILILSATPDASAQYVPMMNCTFSAQKQVR